MAGHSQWANRKHRKARQDAKKGKIFSKMAREIMMLARQGADIESNPGLRAAVERARQFGVPNENIERAIKRGSGELQGENLEELTYEGYGPGGVAVMLRILTDNRNRTANEVRYLFSRNGGNLGETGCVSWMFERKGMILVERDKAPVDEDDLLMLVIDAGADDVEVGDEAYEITMAPERFGDVHDALERAGVPMASAEITYVPNNVVRVEGKEATQLLKLIDALEDHDDVQDVYANYEIADDVLAAFQG